MYKHEKQIKTKEIDSLQMYKMIYQLLKANDFYEAKCLTNIFINERTDEEELKVLGIIKDLLFQYTFCLTTTNLDRKIYLSATVNLLECNINDLESINKKKNIVNRIIDKIF